MPDPPVAGLNVLVATPGRLLQHMDETPGFDASSLQILVLDEADRILDMVGRPEHCSAGGQGGWGLEGRPSSPSAQRAA